MIKFDEIEEALKDSFADSEENPNLIKVEATINVYGLDKEKLETHREFVIETLKQLPPEFMKTTGGGWSLMNMVADKDGNQWGEQYMADALYVLANGLGLAAFTLPRAMWEALPGGMPYITVYDDKF